VEQVRAALGVSERRACRVIGQPRSTQRREAVTPEDEARLVADIVELATTYGRYGSAGSRHCCARPAGR
jgi:hypothetical protein